MTSGARGFSRLRNEFAQPLWILLAAVVAVLLIACANVAALLVAQGVARRREVAICLAVGSGRARLVRQQLVASGTLALLGGGIGFLLAAWATPPLVAYAPPLAASALEFGPNVRVLVFTIGLSWLSAVLSGVVPAWRLSRLDHTTV